MEVALRAAMAALLLLLALIDWRQRRIWHVLTLPGSVLALLLSPWLPAGRWQLALLGFVLCWLLLALCGWLARRHYGRPALGFGDVMLAGLIGALGGPLIGLWLLAGGMLAAGAYAAWQLGRGADRHATIPYGVFLALVAAAGVMLA